MEKDIHALVEEKLQADVEFNSTLDGLSEEDKTKAVADKRSSLYSQEFKSLSERAAEAAKNKELADNYKARAEKAEKGAKSGEKVEGDLSSKDLYALMNAKIPEEDIEEVTKAAKLLGKSIPEALKDNVVKSILEKKAEERATANAAHVSGARRTTQKVAPEVLVDKLNKGEVPEKGTSEAEELFWARRGGKK